MTFREARLSLQLLAEEEVGAALRAAARAERAAQEAAADALRQAAPAAQEG